ncbi:MAG: helix-turn-helix domain-containing protein [Clostridiales bacterium]|nr:helix-turn-helix domain-containing protein [Clostridiales bacterium]
MHISSDMLRRGLAEQGIGVTVFGNVDGALGLARVMFAGRDGVFEDGFVYVLDEAEGVASRGRKCRSACVIAGNYDVELIRCFESVFIAEEGLGLPALHNAVQRVFERYDLWSSELRAVLDKGSDVQAMLDIGTSVIDNPLILQDNNYSIIAVSTDYAGNPSLEPMLDSDNIPYMMMADRSSYGRDDEGSSVVPLRIRGRHALYHNIFQQGRFQYRLLVLETKGEFHPSTATLLEFISGYIQLAIGFVVDESKESHELPFIMKSILSGEYKDLGFVEQRLGEYGWQKGHSYICAKIHAELADYRNRAMRFMSDRLATVFPEACIFEYENSIAAFCNLSLSNYDMASVEESLKSFLQDNNMQAGLSNEFSGFDYLRQYYMQAGEALRLGPRAKPYQWLYRFENVKEQFVLESCTGNLPARMICEPGLLRLRDYDERNNQELYRTLYVYLKNSRKSVAAAKELFIHRSTFLYRLDRIREIMGPGVDNEQGQWYLLLSYKLLEREER